MRFGFVTCVQLGLSCIEEIHDLGGHLDLLVTLRDDIAPRKSGRVHLDDVATEHSIPLHKCRSFNDPETVAAVREADLDWLFVIGWSQIAHTALLGAPRRGVLGMHPTLLPEGRGRASIPWAILKDLPETGVTLFQLDEGVDTGPVLARRHIDLHPAETAATLYDKVTDAHVDLIRDVWPRLEADDLAPMPQDHTAATEWPGRTPADGRITSDLTVSEVDRLVRATTSPYPGAFVDTPSGPITVWAGCVDSERAPKDALPLHQADGLYFATVTELRA